MIQTNWPHELWVFISKKSGRECVRFTMCVCVLTLRRPDRLVLCQQMEACIIQSGGSFLLFLFLSHLCSQRGTKQDLATEDEQRLHVALSVCLCLPLSFSLPVFVSLSYFYLSISPSLLCLSVYLFFSFSIWPTFKTSFPDSLLLLLNKVIMYSI